MKNKYLTKDIKFYEIVFPVWLLFIFPLCWFVVIPIYFALCSLVIVLGMFCLKVDNKKVFYKKHIIKSFIICFLSSLFGGLLLFVTQFFEKNEIVDEFLSVPLSTNPYDNFWSLLYTFFAVVLSGVLIYIFNMLITFRKEKSKKFKRVFSLVLAVLTAPYLFLVPSETEHGNFTNHIVWSEYTRAELYLKDDPEKDILSDDSGKTFDYVLVSTFRDGINTADRAQKDLPENWEYKIVFHKQNSERTAMDEILIYEYGGNFYFKWKNKCYVIDESGREEIKSELNEHLNPVVRDEEVQV